jgi:lysophospholipase L1-like esterase
MGLLDPPALSKAQGDVRYARLPLGRPGPRWLFYGDSIVAGGVDTSSAQSYWLGSFCVQLALLSGGQVLHSYNAGQPGQNTAYLLANFDTLVTPNTANIDCILFNTGAHDAGITNFATWTASFIGVVQKILALGKIPILTTMFPQTGATTTIQTGISQTNSWIRRYAAKNGYICLDVYRAATDPTTGGYRAGYSTDNIHPTAMGQTAIGQALVNQITSLLPPAACVTPQWYADPNNLLSNSLFTTWSTSKVAPTIAAGATISSGGSLAPGTYFYVVTYLDFVGSTTASNEISVTITSGQQSVINITNNNGPGARQYRIFRSTSSGAEVFLDTTTTLSYTDAGTKVPTTQPPASVNGTSYPTGWAWNAGGPEHASQVADAAALGSVIRFTDYNGRNTSDALQQAVNAGAGKFAVGDKLAIMAKVRTAGGMAPAVKVVATPSGVPINFLSDGTSAWGFGQYYQEFVVSAGTTALTVYLQAQPGTLTVDYAEVGLYNLTAMGVL